MAAFNRKRIGDLLVDSGKITQEQLQEVLKKQRATGKRIGELLIEEKLLSQDDVIDILEIQNGIPRVYMEMTTVDKEAIQAVPESLANKYILIPIKIKDNTIHVAMADPLNMFALDDVKIASGYEVEPLLAGKDEILKAIDKYYSGQYIQKAAEDLTKEHMAASTQQVSEDIEEDVKNAPVVRLIDSIIKNASKAGASDIHIEPFEKYVRIRYRIDGELKEVLKSPKETLGALIARIKILANLNIAERRVPQDGRIVTEFEGSKIDLRVSTIPTIFGEKAVIRILSRENFIIGKEKLGLNALELEQIDSMLKVPYGIILVSGPTGSGKSTTLYSMLNDLNSDTKNIITVEDPVEYMMEGINQVNVNAKAGLTFASGLRSILRQDPDIVMIGEIRDNETAEIAIRAAITGHLVLSTIHTNDAPSSVIRLMDMGIEPYLVASAVAGIVSQRLVRKVCSHCNEEYEATEYEKKLLNVDVNKPLKLNRGKGCDYCGGSGYLGRTGVYEIMEIEREHREYIMNNKNTDELRDLCIKKGMKTLRNSCIDLVQKGITTTEELARIAYLKE
ncbi:type II secretion system protein E [Clostridium pasteurianum DSM 525 = ATCC 6013]|uniref:Type II secretion system protein E n=1 Tax=Clostridium pasteurianum DSM 525 = ATCC 6013 TaxID=1262449 RepID=A0A0H3J2A4_CLOPA|nr:ATPase, T2SS/T4P/T4SS family [Clostridium pasteurianum]AJA47554.1 type II secretion system protein E [Clostridium pasteurianum DSM 525 = ATCC 6013]AJA51542.1 type II secretion system protein E [Clostridium pasteurianum DSM 525 = ATCC 6013]AOZ74869.1 type II secretion system protein GspE [Clostridium pasteurianum DSM 525 = ATCC 6013]AOZ78664.1 type II secretion system protein GspE [Clostridium pasteurianum]ELP58105.1 type IV fimbrial assembly protein PilB [Clostridium pasteurianum DSM 525 = 